MSKTIITSGETAYHVGTHRYSFRAGEPAAVLGVEICRPNNLSTGNYLEPRACYKLLYGDGVIDYAPLSDPHKLVRLSDLAKPEMVTE